MWEGAVGAALGLILVYVILSLVVSGIQELIAAVFKLRSNNLQKGVMRLLGNDKDAVRAFYRHSLIRSIVRSDKSKPSYIPGKRFASVLMDQFELSAASDEDELRAAIDKIEAENNVLGNAIKALAQSADHDTGKLQAELALWFDDAMERVSGWYVRTARWIGLCVAIVVVVLMNADSVRIGKAIWTNTELQVKLEAMARESLDVDQLEPLQIEGEQVLANLPLGWACPIPAARASMKDGGPDVICVDDSNFHWTSLFGWAVTIFAVSLGAPFWFDLLGRVARLRATGGRPKPSGKSQ